MYYYGMADTSGQYSAWIGTPRLNRLPFRLTQSVSLTTGTEKVFLNSGTIVSTAREKRSGPVQCVRIRRLRESQEFLWYEWANLSLLV